MSKILYNFWYKVASFVIALVIWTLVQGSDNIEKSVYVDVKIDVPEGYIIKEGNERHISATIVGPSAIVERTQNSDLRARINLKEKETGSYEVEVRPSHITNLDSRLKVNIKNPVLSLFIDKEVSKKVPIKEILQGYVSPGFKVESVQMEPSIIEVTGAKTELEGIQFVQTDPIDISGLEASTNKNVFLVKSTSLSVSYSVKKVAVSISVVPNAATKVLKDIPIHIQSLKYTQKQLDMTPSTIEVEVEVGGDISRLDNVPVDQVLNAVVVLQNAPEENEEQNIQVYPLMDGIKVLRVIPAKTIINLKK